MSKEAPVALTLPPDLVEFLESGVSMLVGTRDAELVPECVRAVGASVSSDRRLVSVLLNEATAALTVANARAGSPIALTCSRPIDHRTVQIKGRCAAVRPGSEADRLRADRYLAAFVESLYLVNIARGVTRRMRVWPCLVLDLVPDELFQQTPGPSAGELLARGT